MVPAVCRALIAGMLLWCAGAFQPSTNCSAETLAVISRIGIVPYDEFIQGFQHKNSLSSPQQYTLQIYYLKPADNDALASIREDIAALRPRLIVSVGLGATQFSASRFSDIPLIYSMTLAPESFKSRSSRQMLAVGMETAIEQRLQMLKKLKPDVKKIGLLYDPQRSEQRIIEMRRSIQSLGMELTAVPVDSPRAAFNAVPGIMRDCDAFYLMFDRTVLNDKVIEHIFTSSFRRKVPVVGLSEKYVRLGALFSLDVDSYSLGMQTFGIAADCLSDRSRCSGFVRPAQSAVKLIINRKIAEKLNISLPEETLLKAHRIY